MVLDAVSNFVRGSTDAEVGTSDTTVSVEDASIFPDPEDDGEFNVVIWDVNNFPRPDQDGDVEILRVTARDTTADELTVVRGQETTSAAAHPEGSAIHLSPTAKMFSDIEDTFGDFWDAGTQELTADVNNTNATTTTLEAEEVNTERIGSDRHYASNDSDLDAILTNVSDGDKILLGNSDFEEDRTFSDRVSIEGIAGENRGTTISGTWTIQSRGGRVDNIGFIGSDGGLVIDTDRVVVSRVRIGPGVIDVKDDECILSMLVGGSVTFESGTSDGIVDSSTGVSVTDNGNNTVGDIA